MKKPNILLIMSDEHDPAVMGCYGDPVVKTPYLDTLAAEGITYDAAYTTSPLCVPARLSFTAGKYVSRCGGWNNDSWLPSDDYPSLPRTMNAAGYDSILCGKMHYDPSRRYGFRELFPAFSNRKRKEGRGGRRAYDDESVGGKHWDARSAEFHPGVGSGILDHDRQVTVEAIRFLRQRSDGDQPFFMLAGYLAPHFPLIVPDAYAERYRGRVPMPNLPAGAIGNLPTNYRHQRMGFGNDGTEDPVVVREGRELYWGLTNWLDDEVGMLLESLKHSTDADNTVVIYTSDHGENRGEHGMWWKNCMYEHAARVPLIVWWPKRWKGGRRVSGACSLADLVKTIAELGEADVPEDWDGSSLLANLDDPSVPEKDLAVSEYYGHNVASGFSMVRQGPWKYVYHNRFDKINGPEYELYNLNDDPGEFSNLAGDPVYAERMKAMHTELVREIGREPDEAEVECRADYARTYGREEVKTVTTVFGKTAV